MFNVLAAVTGFDAVLENVGKFLTSLIGWIGPVVTLFTDNPLLLLPLFMTIGMTAFKIVPKLLKGKG